MPQDPVKKSEAADSRRTRQERQVAAATDPFIAHDHVVYVEGCFRCDLSRAEVAQVQDCK